MEIYKEVKKTDPELYDTLIKELNRQETTLELIASENFVSPAVLSAQGGIMTNKYAEGYPGKRYYGGCEFVDMAEELAISRAKVLFNAEHVNVQPHSGSQANMAVYFSVLKPGDTILGMDLSHGGHLTHGSPVNFSGRFYNVISYGVSREKETIDYDNVEKLAIEYKPKMIVAGASAYPRIIDFEAFRKICDKIDAYLFVDMAHIAGLVAAGLHPNPVPYADFVTTTTHKTLRGPRGGLILCKSEYAKKINSQIFPGIQGGPLMHVIAAKAVALKEAMSDDFRKYQSQIIKNAAKLGTTLRRRGFKLVSDGTDNHLMCIDLTGKNITGKDAENRLEGANITVNKNTIPFETRSPFITSGLRIGTPAVTTRNMKEQEMETIGSCIADVLDHMGSEEMIIECRKKVATLCNNFPIYKGIIF